MDYENKNDSENRGYQPQSSIGQYGYQPHVNKENGNKSDASTKASNVNPPKGSDAKDA